MRALFAPLLLLATLVGCHAARTQVVVVIDADSTIRTQTTTVNLEVWRFDGTRGDVLLQEPVTPSEMPGRGLVPWPFQTVLAPLNNDPTRRYEVSATAIDSMGRTLVVSRAISGYTPGDTRVLRLFLSAQCRSDVAPVCAETETCNGGRCVPIFRQPESLPTLTSIDAGPSDAYAPPDLDAGPSDAGVDAYVPNDAGPRVFGGMGLGPTRSLDASALFGASLSTSADGTRLAVSVEGMSEARVYDERPGLGRAEAVVDTSTLGSGTNMQVALSAGGDYLAVGWPQRGSAPTEFTSDGLVRLFHWNGVSWIFEAELWAPNRYDGNEFGRAIALSGDGSVLVVGAPGESGGGSTSDTPTVDLSVSHSGAAYVFIRSGSTWTFRRYLKAASPQVGDRFGIALALSADGSTLAVGAPKRESPEMNGGAVYIFDSSPAFVNRTSILRTDARDLDRTNDRFGSSLALDAAGTTLLIGAPYEDSNGVGRNGVVNEVRFDFDSGAAYLYQRSGMTWTATAYLKPLGPAEGAHFGAAVALSQDGVWLGIAAPLIDDPLTDCGAVYAYSLVRDDFQRVQVGAPEASSELGSAIAWNQDGARLFVAAPHRTMDTGAVYLYQ